MDTLWQVRAHAGEPTACVKVVNLASTIQAGHDAWGRANKLQPVSISATVQLSAPFQRATDTDDMADDTVHYGLLSKAVLSAIATINKSQSDTAATKAPVSLRGVLDGIWATLTGASVAGAPLHKTAKPFLNLDYVRALSVSVRFPKASLLGSGVSLEAIAVYPEKAGAALRAWMQKEEEALPVSLVDTFGLALKIHEMRVPTLIGLNDNERFARQVVVTDVQIDKYTESEDLYTQLEAIVQKSMDESSFGTLEALASKVTADIKKDYLSQRESSAEGKASWQLKISMTKPTAVPMAEGACVEFVTV
ncbi:hypothetical protein BROUX41_004780 [Berkeleyomyces rouxiae]